jgi:hypothetical protein
VIIITWEEKSVGIAGIEGNRDKYQKINYKKQISRTKSQEPKSKNQKQEPSKEWIIDDR